MASKRRLRRKNCDSKMRYAGKPEADTAAHFARVRSGDWVMSYKCKHCNGWHIGHPPKHVREAIDGRV